MKTMSWTDERLDDFAAETARRFDSLEVRVNERFDTVDHRFDEVDRRFGEVDRRFGEVDRRFGEVNSRLDRLGDRIEAGSSRIDALHRTILFLGGGALVTFVVGFAGVIATQ